jgi:oligoribonuclease
VYFASPPKAGNHRALADIQESIEELRYYRAAVFVPPPGPDSDTARAHAAEHGGSLTASEENRVALEAEATGTGEPVS